MRLFGLRLTLLNKIVLIIFLLIGLPMNVLLFAQQYHDELNIGADIVVFQKHRYVTISYGGVLLTYYYTRGSIYSSETKDIISIDSPNDIFIPFTYCGIGRCLVKTVPIAQSLSPIPSPKQSSFIICYTCHGMGSCQVCKGAGVFSMYGQSSVCSGCNGTGRCWHCHGSGKQ